jgi:hypothetical protein
MKHEGSVLDALTGEIRNVNTNFVQFYEDNLNLILQMNIENHSAVNVLLWIVRRMDNRNALVASQQTIANALSLSRQTINASVAYLREKKALTVLKSGNTNVYAVNVQIVWKSTADNKRYAHFDAKVYISDFEQEEERQNVQTQLFGHAVKGKTVNKKSIKKGAVDFTSLQSKIDSE